MKRSAAFVLGLILSCAAQAQIVDNFNGTNGVCNGDVTGPCAANTVSKIQGTTVSGTTGTGNVVFSASPVLSGTVTGTYTLGGTPSLGTVLNAGVGSSTPVYGTGLPTILNFTQGTDASPVTTAGTQIRMLYRHNVTKDQCFNNADDTGCISPLLINAIGGTSTDMVTGAATFYSSASSALSAGASSQAINAVGDVLAGGTGAGTGAYLQGRTYSNTGTARAHGAEISTGNYSASDYCTVNTSGVSACDGIWLTSRAATAGWSLSAGLHIGTAGDGSFWKEGISLTDNSIVSSGTSFHDLSTGANSILIEGTHATAALAVATGAGQSGFGTTSPVAKVDIAPAGSFPAWTTSGIGLRVRGGTISDTTSSGTVASNFINTIGAPTLTATNASTYTTATNLYIDGCPVASTNVTITNCNAFVVNSGGVFLGSGNVTMTGNFFLPQSTVATLPTCNGATSGSMRMVTDANTDTPTYRGTLTGGGAFKVPVTCSWNGSAGNWRAS